MINCNSYPVSYRVKFVLLLACFVLFLWTIYEWTTPWFIEIPLENVREEMQPVKGSEFPKRLVISVFYEALCPDSRSFFLRHLLPTFEQSSNYITLNLIPYGKAKTIAVGDGRYKFSCQHGETECFANKIHACAIAYLVDQMQLLKYTTCMIDNSFNPSQNGELCASEFGVDWSQIKNCAIGSQGEVLLMKHGLATDQLSPPISFVPTILLDGKQHRQASILKDLRKVICQLYGDVVRDCLT